MRFVKYFVIVGLSLLMGACPLWERELDIDIGDYESQLEAWNSQNMLDYLFVVEYWFNRPEGALITVRNGIPESSDPKYWLEEGHISTIPEFYSLIKNREESMKDEHGNGGNRSLSLKVSYNTEYHYPSSIILKINGNTTMWTMSLMPLLEEGELDIDIGDYEYHLEAWNSQNMLDYQISMKLVSRTHGGGADSTFVSNVKNGIPDRDTQKSFFYTLKEATVPEIYSFIKEKEENIRNLYNGMNHPYLHVQYNTEYHYPMLISLGVDLFDCHLYERWEITITPEETE